MRQNLCILYSLSRFIFIGCWLSHFSMNNFPLIYVAMKSFSVDFAPSAVTAQYIRIARLFALRAIKYSLTFMPLEQQQQQNTLSSLSCYLHRKFFNVWVSRLDNFNYFFPPPIRFQYTIYQLKELSYK
jgi:hypothetical protein